MAWFLAPILAWTRLPLAVARAKMCAPAALPPTKEMAWVLGGVVGSGGGDTGVAYERGGTAAGEMDASCYLDLGRVAEEVDGGRAAVHDVEDAVGQARLLGLVGGR